jgi:cytochrome c oxidase subunit 4
MSDAHSEAIAPGLGAGHGGTVSHVVPMKVLIAVWAALLALTVVTVAVVKVDLGSLNLWIAMGIATLKAALVVLYFMHMRYDRPFNAIIFVTALLFVMLFVSIAMLDTRAYEPDVVPGYAPGMPK